MEANFCPVRLVSTRDAELSDAPSFGREVEAAGEVLLIPLALGAALPFDVKTESFGLAASLSASCFFRASQTFVDGLAGEGVEPVGVAWCVPALDDVGSGGLERVEVTAGDGEILTPLAVSSVLCAAGRDEDALLMLRPLVGALEDWDARRSRSAYVVLPVVDDQADMLSEDVRRF